MSDNIPTLLPYRAITDHRGVFSAIFRQQTAFLENNWPNLSTRQISISQNILSGTLRGLHIQNSSTPEAKLITCIAGSVFDVAVDMRPSSSTYLSVFPQILSASVTTSYFIPPGFAHGFQTLEPNTSLLYIHSADWSPDDEQGYRWDDPILDIKWPLPVQSISDRDSSHPYLQSGQ